MYNHCFSWSILRHTYLFFFSPTFYKKNVWWQPLAMSILSFIQSNYSNCLIARLTCHSCQLLCWKLLLIVSWILIIMLQNAAAWLNDKGSKQLFWHTWSILPHSFVFLNPLDYMPICSVLWLCVFLLCNFHTIDVLIIGYILIR